MRGRKRPAVSLALIITSGLAISAWILWTSGLRQAVRHHVAVFSAGSTIERYLATTAVRKLQIGAGPNNLPGWLNTDISPRRDQVFLDAMKPFPIPDGALHYVYAEQVIEHLPFEGAMVMLRESHRTLVPGGRLRLATPDLSKLLGLFDEDETQSELDFMAAQLRMERLSVPRVADRPPFVLNMYFREWGHQFLYDRGILQGALEVAGFRNIRVVRHQESEDPALRDVERHADVIGVAIDHYVTMIVEAMK